MLVGDMKLLRAVDSGTVFFIEAEEQIGEMGGEQAQSTNTLWVSCKYVRISCS